MGETKYTPKPPLPWVVRKNPMRDDGWFISANPKEAVGMRHSDGSPIIQYDSVIGYQLNNKELADFIALACNSHDDLLAERDRLKDINAELVTALNDLIDLQNGPPLLQHAKEWKEAMEAAEAAIARANKGV